mgnify:FL=1|tara:strand:- start:20157 stop:21956 length:1800 start_codon:yes stop_codon:yes gene_type:complete
MEEVAQALIHRYIKEGSSTPNVDITEVSAYLQQLSELPDPGTLAGLVRDNKPQWQLDDLSIAILSSVDDCATLIFRITQMAPQVDRQFRRILPRLAAALLESPELPISQTPTLLMILDALNLSMVGWTEGLGAGSNKLQTVFEDAINRLLNPDTDLDALFTEVSTFMLKESDKIRRLEERLAASETGLVRSKQAKVLAANLINKHARNKHVTESLTNFLRGPWYDSLQLLVNEKGIRSEEWQRAGALTETILWTYQPIDPDAEGAEQEKQRLYRLIEHLPGEVRQLLVALAHNTDGVEAALESLEVDHVALVSGLTPDYIEFEPLTSEQTSSKSTVSRVLLRKVNELTSGQWFSHTEGDHIQLIKLVLKLDDVNQLLFTNRNGMKVMQKSFDEFAYDLSSHVVKSINPDAAFSSTFSTYYQGLINELRKHRKLIAERKAEVDRLDEDRKKAQQKAQLEAKQLSLDKEEAERSRQEALKLSRLASARAEAEKSENADLVVELTAVVASLAAGAVVYLPDAMGEKQECKLAVRINAANKMIFVDRNGMKAGDYQSGQLVELLVAGEAELGDQGIEFEDTLAAVVTKLRSDREKSYDDLTGT